MSKDPKKYLESRLGLLRKELQGYNDSFMRGKVQALEEVLEWFKAEWKEPIKHVFDWKKGFLCFLTGQLFFAALMYIITHL